MFFGDQIENIDEDYIDSEDLGSLDRSSSKKDIYGDFKETLEDLQEQDILLQGNSINNLSKQKRLRPGNTKSSSQDKQNKQLKFEKAAKTLANFMKVEDPVELAFSYPTIFRFLKKGVNTLPYFKQSELLNVLDPECIYDNILEESSYSVIEQLSNSEVDYVSISVNKMKLERHIPINDLFFTNTLIWLCNFQTKWQLTHNKKCAYTLQDQKKPKEGYFKGGYDQYMNRYVCIRGRIKRITSEQYAITTNVYKCSNCERLLTLDKYWYEESKKKETLKCECGAKENRLVELIEQRLLENWQTVTVQEESVDSVGLNTLDCRILGGIGSDKLVPGEIVVIRGLLQTQIGPKTRPRPYIDGYGFDTIIEKANETLTKKKQELYNSYSVLPFNEIWEKVEKSIFPNIYGLSKVKQGLILQVLKGSTTQKRKNIHVALFGNPGLGKSELIKCISKNFKGVYCVGNNITVPGLTATVYRDHQNEWNLDGGAVVQANTNFLFLDEIDKLKPETLDSILEPMQQQHISISKAGINVTLPAQISLLCGGNPRQSKVFSMNNATSLKAQIGLNPAFWSRLDLKFIITQKQLHEQYTQNQIMSNIFKPNLKPTKEAEDIKGYLKYVSKVIDPVLPEDLRTLIIQYFNTLKQANRELELGFRDLEALIRLTQAKAKLHMHKQVLLEDWEYIKELYEYSISPFKVKKGTLLTQAIVKVGLNELTKKDNTLEEDLLNIIKRNPCKTEPELKRIYEEVTSKTIDQTDLSEALLKMVKKGYLYRPNLENYSSLV